MGKQNKIFLHAVLLTSARCSLKLPYHLKCRQSKSFSFLHSHETKYYNKRKNMFCLLHILEKEFYQHPSTLSFLCSELVLLDQKTKIKKKEKNLCSVEHVTPLKFVLCFTRTGHIFCSRQNKKICVFFNFFPKDCVPARKLTPFISPAGSQCVPSPGRCRYLKQ